MFSSTICFNDCDGQNEFKYLSYDHGSKSGIVAHVVDLFARATLALSGIFLGMASAWTFSHFAIGTPLLLGGISLPGGLAVVGGAAALFVISYVFHALCDRRGTM